MRSILLASGVAAATALSATAVSAREDTGKRFQVTLQGEIEVPKLGDPDGTGSATIRVNPGRGQVCYSLTVTDIAPATAAHIHEAPAGAAGPVVVGLTAPSNGKSEGCVTVSRDEARDIIRNPENYYVNVHNAEYPSGALRAQLQK